MTSLATLDRDIDDWIIASTGAFHREHADPSGDVWLVKFFPPQFLRAFLADPRLVVSTAPGFTWGDGVYAVPLPHVRSAIIYGRVGVMGRMSQSALPRIYDATGTHGITLYQAWIRFRPRLYDLLTTTVHAQHANRQLRNAFRRAYGIDLVAFRPDEFNRSYVDPRRDVWCVVSDFPARGAPVAPAVPRSSRITDCQLVAVGAEEFVVAGNGFLRRDMMGRDVDATSTPFSLRSPTAPLDVTLLRVHAANVRRGGAPPHFALLSP